MRFIGIDPEEDLPRIQALRADPPGLASDGPRRRVFGAALEQWDLLLRAGRSVRPAAAPILLFYAVSQATRALAAAYVDAQDWNPRQHGLSCAGAGGVLGDLVLTPNGGESSAFALLGVALGMAVPTHPVTLGALWAANPHLEPAPGLGAGQRRTLELSAMTEGEISTRARLQGELARGVPTDPQPAVAVLRSRLAAYPAAGEGLCVEGVTIDFNGAPIVDISWRLRDGTPRSTFDVTTGLTSRPNTGSYLVPSLNGIGETAGFLPMWWATLLALSSIARYSPDRWAAALHRDKSGQAVPIEQGLAMAYELLPFMVLDALDPKYRV